MKRFLPKLAVAGGLCSFMATAPATDLDLYVNLASTASSDLPNVLFVIDNTANWSQDFAVEMSAVATTLANLPENRFNVGIMLGTETSEGQPGGYVRAAVRTMNSTTKPLYRNLVNSFDINNDKASGGTSPLAIAEAYYYFAGMEPYSGTGKTKSDHTGNISGGTTASNRVYALGNNALAGKSTTPYRSPTVQGSCSKNYVIYISNGPNQSNNQLDEQAVTLLKAAAGGGAAGDLAAAMIPLVPVGSQSSPIDEWTRFMAKSPYKITTYAIDVNPRTSGQGPGWTAVLKSMAGSNYQSVTLDGNIRGGEELSKAIIDALSKIQSVNSVFAAVSLPASANVQGAFLNQLFVGMFRPDANSRPRWNGNLKQYRLGDLVDLVDADGAGAINTQTGFIAACARSYWTPSLSSPDTYWTGDPQGNCLPPSGSNDQLYAVSNSPDGNIVEKGAQGYTLRGRTPASRVVKTCAKAFASCTTLTDFATTNAAIVASDFGAAVSTAAERTELINWARGENNANELGLGLTVMRPSAHGDVIHSNPLALSFNNNADVVVYYGGNDGMLRAVNGNRTTNFGNSAYAPGQEMWAFMPPEFYKHVKRLRSNSTLVSVAEPTNTTTPAVGTEEKPFGIDGPLSVYRNGSDAWLFAAMRRGGRALYAFDVSNPVSPTLKWKMGCPIDSDTGCTTRVEDGAADTTTSIGQTWSTPRPMRARGYQSGNAPLLVMGGGYHQCEDADRNTCATSQKGNVVYVLNANTGAIVKSFTTARPVVAEIRFAPDADGYAMYGYAIDLGGNMYRITIASAAPSAWTMTKIAELGCASRDPLCTANRKFMFAPSVVPETDGTVSIYVGTGDREKPLGASYFPNSATVANYFFKVKDNPASVTWLTEEFLRCGGNFMCLASLGTAGSTSTGTCSGLAPTTGKGWYLGLRAGEQVVTTAATRFGVTTFSTHIPAVATPGTCGSNLGTVHVYNLQIATAASAPGTTCGDVVTGGGLPPPPEKLDVCWNADCTQKKSISIGSTTDSSLQSEANEPQTNTLTSNGKRRVYWYIQK